jgi:hypothetical protein
MGGAYAIMIGVLCLVGQRVMSHMHDVLVVQKGEKPKAAAPGAEVSEI